MFQPTLRTLLRLHPEKRTRINGRITMDGEDVLALRGDHSPSRPESPDFKHASDLTSFIKWKKPEFSVHGACYPEGHPEADSLLHDVENLRIKQAAGAEHLLTQLFFDNMHFYRFLNLARRAGITLPVSAGVMPIVKRSQIEELAGLGFVEIPPYYHNPVAGSHYLKADIG